ncbi:hypothetical protein N7486_008376, partial [Penicillium sp. IBT 16267x]
IQTLVSRKDCSQQNQNKSRRRTNLMKKAYEYSKMCDADVCVGIRLRETGQVHVLSLDDSEFWAFLNSQLYLEKTEEDEFYYGMINISRRTPYQTLLWCKQARGVVDWV